jgi:hypothetical protein
LVIRWCLAPLAPLALISAPVSGASCTRTVNPADYDQFFVWAGARPVVVPEPVRVVYLLAGEVGRRGPPRLTLLNGGPHAGRAQVWLVVRTDRLDWSPATFAAVLATLARWQAAGNVVIGLQIDFDAATGAVDRYAAFLAAVRRVLPAQWKLSATGLLDWGAHGDPAALARLAGTVDELVMQTYRGRHTEPGFASYFPAIAQLPVRHKVALVAGGVWCAPPALASDRRFDGYVVFLPGIGTNNPGP